jgi:hypothetical protein
LGAGIIFLAAPASVFIEQLGSQLLDFLKLLRLKGATKYGSLRLTAPKIAA